ncbi:MAG: PKD domain-containing protein [Thermoplasmata archaeon]
MRRNAVVMVVLIVLASGLQLPSTEALGEGEVEPPILVPEAGPNQTVSEGDQVVFDGTASYVINGTLDEYYWDFDANVDSDSDGNFTNDKDAAGAVVAHKFGDNGDYVVTLTIGSKVIGTEEGLVAQDTVLIIDSSGSMGWNDPMELRQEAATDYVDLMGENDSAAVVVFGRYPPRSGFPRCNRAAWLVHDRHLTETDQYGKAQVKDAIDYTRFDSGATNIEKALQVAHMEILSGYSPTPTELFDCSPDFPDPGGNAKEDHAWVEILLTDGLPTHSLSATMDEVQIAAYAGIRIFTIGLGGGVDEDYLKDIAYQTGGRFYFAPTADDLQEIYNNISKIVKTIIGGTIYASDGLTVHVENVAPQLDLAARDPMDEGDLVDFWVNVTDPGSDDIHLLYEWGDGTANETYDYLNSPPDPDPYPSPEVNPRDISERRTHTYGDNWNYSVVVTAWDDDGGVAVRSLEASVGNLPPDLSLSIPPSATEGESLMLQASASDEGSDDLTFTWFYGDGTSERATYYNDGIGPDPLPSPEGTYPFSADDVRTHAWGDDGIYDIMVRVEDDDGGQAFATTRLTITNLPPEIVVPSDTVFDEGVPFALSVTATDPGSDDLEFSWALELGPTFSAIYYNDGIGPDPFPSPRGIFPFSVSDAIAHTYGDDGIYSIALTLRDDDGAVVWTSFQVEVRNVAPNVDGGGPYADAENSEISFDGWASDPGSDDLTFIWKWGDGTVETALFLNGDTADSPKSPWGTYPFNATHSTTHTWGDNGNFDVTLTVMDDDGGTTIHDVTVVVDNIEPVIVSLSYQIMYNLPRTHGYWKFQCEGMLPSPDHVGIQQGFIDYISSRSRVFGGITTKQEVCDYLEDVEGSDMRQKALQQLMALWLNIASDKIKIPSDMFIPQLNATMNLMEFMVWIEETVLNDPDNIWLAKDLADAINNGELIPYALITATVTASDPGSDDLFITWGWGDGHETEHVYYNDGVGPDPYPSPEINPVLVTDTANHSYASPGTYLIILTVADDDGGHVIVFIPLGVMSPHPFGLDWNSFSRPNIGFCIDGDTREGIPIHEFEETMGSSRPSFIG